MSKVGFNVIKSKGAIFLGAERFLKENRAVFWSLCSVVFYIVRLVEDKIKEENNCCIKRLRGEEGISLLFVAINNV